MKVRLKITPDTPTAFMHVGKLINQVFKIDGSSALELSKELMLTKKYSCSFVVPDENVPSFNGIEATNKFRELGVLLEIEEEAKN